MQTTQQQPTIITQVAGLQWLIPSASVPGDVHVVKQVRGVVSCDCLGYLHRSRCYHQAAIIRHLAAADAARLDTIRQMVKTNNPLIRAKAG